MRIDDIKALDPKRVIVLDTETTGLKPYGNDEILSLTIIDLEGTVLFNELVKPEKQSGKRDIISTVLTFMLAIVAVLAITSLFSEWQMAVTYGFLFIVLLLVKAYRDGRNNAK